jgi:uncharacterized protein
MRIAALLLLVLILASCGARRSAEEQLNNRMVTLPGGQRIEAEVMVRPEDMARGMMFRDSLAPDHGMLFVHTQPGYYRYWMFQVRIPLDIIWMDTDHRVAEISANTPPCTTTRDLCPTYGGHARAQFALELAGGMAAKYGLKEGDRIDF